VVRGGGVRGVRYGRVQDGFGVSAHGRGAAWCVRSGVHGADTRPHAGFSAGGHPSRTHGACCAPLVAPVSWPAGIRQYPPRPADFGQPAAGARRRGRRAGIALAHGV